MVLERERISFFWWGASIRVLQEIQPMPINNIILRLKSLRVTLCTMKMLIIKPFFLRLLSWIFLEEFGH